MYRILYRLPGWVHIFRRRRHHSPLVFAHLFKSHEILG
jgi:hypothetical protein